MMVTISSFFNAMENVHRPIRVVLKKEYHGRRIIFNRLLIFSSFFEVIDKFHEKEHFSYRWSSVETPCTCETCICILIIARYITRTFI